MCILNQVRYCLYYWCKNIIHVGTNTIQVKVKQILNVETVSGAMSMIFFPFKKLCSVLVSFLLNLSYVSSAHNLIWPLLRF